MSFYDLEVDSKLTRAQQLVAKDKDGAKQSKKLSEHSSGPVANNEILARSLEYPNKFNSEGGLNETLFSDAFTRGASAQRLLNGWEAQTDEIHERFESRATKRREGCDGRPPNKEMRVRLMVLAQKRGLFVSPYLTMGDLIYAQTTGCELHFCNVK